MKNNLQSQFSITSVLPPRHLVQPLFHRTHACSQLSLEPALVPKCIANTLTTQYSMPTLNTRSVRQKDVYSEVF